MGEDTLNIAIIGSNGQLGSDLSEVFSNSGFSASRVTHDDMDDSDLESCSMLLDLKPDVVINTAAFHKTDACEDEPSKPSQSTL
jgi:dTDP-4-dehydrorhamnose reductase